MPPIIFTFVLVPSPNKKNLGEGGKKETGLIPERQGKARFILSRFSHGDIACPGNVNHQGGSKPNLASRCPVHPWGQQREENACRFFFPSVVARSDKNSRLAEERKRRIKAPDLNPMLSGPTKKCAFCQLSIHETGYKPSRQERDQYRGGKREISLFWNHRAFFRKSHANKDEVHCQIFSRGKPCQSIAEEGGV